MTRLLNWNSLRDSLAFTGTKPLVLFCFILLAVSGQSQLLYQESFDEGNDAINGVDDLGNGVTWTSSCPDCLPSGNSAGANDFFKIVNGKLSGQDTNGPAFFESSDIDISSCSGNLEISLNIEESGPMEDCGTGCNSADWIQLEYSYDGGNNWVQPSNSYFCAGPCADNNVIVSGDLAGVVNYNTGCIPGGQTIRIRITVQCWAADEMWMIDDVEVNCVPIVTPSFNPVSDICSGTSLSPLPTVSANGITGSWSPALDNQNTTTYTFTPDAGQCSEPVDLTISVLPTYSNVEAVSVCQGVSYTYPDGTSETITGNTSHVSNLTTIFGGCDSVITTNVTMTQGVNNVINVNVCAGQDYTFADGTVVTNIQSNQSYNSIFSLVGGCDSIVTENITVGTSLPLDLVVAEPLCYGQNNGSVSINVNAGGIEPGATFVITDSDSTVLNQGNSNAAEFLATGWYFCYVDNPTGCDGFDSVFLDQPDSLFFEIATETPLCSGNSDGQAWVTNVFNAQGPYTIAWNGSVTGSDSIFTLASGAHTGLLVDSVGCTALIDFSLVDPAIITLGQITGDPSHCRGNGIYPGSGTVSATANGGTGTLQYIWTNGIDSSNTNTWGNRTPGWYYLSVLDANGCTVYDSVYVDSLNPIADFSVNPDFGYAPLLVTVADQSMNRTTNTWIFNDSLQNSILVDFDSLQASFDSSFTEANTHSICLIVSNDYECYDTLCQSIQANPTPVLEIPNVITPNGDGKNDVWNPFENNGLQSVSCTIFNRWGVKVFEIIDLNTPFTGNDQSGKMLSDGVYSMVYEAVGLDQVEYKGQGFIHLIRK